MPSRLKWLSKKHCVGTIKAGPCLVTPCQTTLAKTWLARLHPTKGQAVQHHSDDFCCYVTPSFADAEFTEYFTEQIIRRELPGNT
jgi:hypothetical protein